MQEIHTLLGNEIHFMLEILMRAMSLLEILTLQEIHMPETRTQPGKPIRLHQGTCTHETVTLLESLLPEIHMPDHQQIIMVQRDKEPLPQDL